jgi:hypothetical protein
VPHPGRFTPRENPVPIVQEVGRAPLPVWKGAENLAHAGIRFPEDRPACSEPLCRLSYPGPFTRVFCIKINENYIFQLVRDRQQ